MNAYEPLLRLLENPLRCPEHETEGLPYWRTLDLSCPVCHEVATVDVIQHGIRQFEQHLAAVAIEDQLMRALWAVTAEHERGDENEQIDMEEDE